jgi:hypothetical protein
MCRKRRSDLTFCTDAHLKENLVQEKKEVKRIKTYLESQQVTYENQRHVESKSQDWWILTMCACFSALLAEQLEGNNLALRALLRQYKDILGAPSEAVVPTSV